MATTDTRPRYNYRLPDGGVAAVIYDHGDLPKTEIGYQTIGGKVVAARLVSLTPHYPDGHERDLNGSLIRARGNAAADDAQVAALEEGADRHWSRARLPRAHAVSNGDRPPCYALKCPGCGDIDTLHATDIRVRKTRGKVELEIVIFKCTECGRESKPPTEIT